jgi:hypothetical protein
MMSSVLLSVVFLFFTDITNRILRHDNYMIALVNKRLLDLRIPWQTTLDRVKRAIRQYAFCVGCVCCTGARLANLGCLGRCCISWKRIGLLCCGGNHRQQVLLPRDHHSLPSDPHQVNHHQPVPVVDDNGSDGSCRDQVSIYCNCCYNQLPNLYQDFDDVQDVDNEDEEPQLRPGICQILDLISIYTMVS